MPSKFVRLILDSENELVINLETVCSVHKIGSHVVVQFIEDSGNLPFTGDVADSLWNYFASHSITIHRAAHSDKNAEALEQQDFSANRNS
ncbi:hypothetical protein [Calothrix sp. PCC 7507]|uniref:hypothetical protein n=1 Tax=Calothrix sp. PCC 7507 TaxID=99598 RepID=UPI00029EF391|nr:hypothetical protein [Calothrix sp. PCC 7507]AFY31617.1 hypothetical protein Cal7507_1143 [Calothrix sp. PCC 7507]